MAERFAIGPLQKLIDARLVSSLIIKEEMDTCPGSGDSRRKLLSEFSYLETIMDLIENADAAAPRQREWLEQCPKLKLTRLLAVQHSFDDLGRK